MGNSESKVLIDLQANASKVHDRLKTASKVIMKQYDKKKFDALIKKNEEDAEELLKGDPRYVYLVADKRNLIKFKKSFEDVLTYFFDATKNWENWNNFSEDFKLQWLQDLIIETKKICRICPCHDAKTSSWSRTRRSCRLHRNLYRIPY